jgi:4-hydroxy-4-methyl-2-oxoglutarate aldolase
MADAPILAIRKDWPRVDAATLKAFAGTPAGFLVDAMGRQGALHHSIRAVWDGPGFVGSALPVWTTARDNLAPYAALTVAKPGDVIVVAAGGYDQGAIMGDVMIGMFRNAGIVAAVTDGLVRDVAGIREVGIPVYASGVSPNSPFKNGPGGVGVPIALGGAIVEPGDLVLGDSEGVVVCPRARIAETLEALKAVRAKEATMDKWVRSGVKQPDWLAAALAEKGVRYID